MGYAPTTLTFSDEEIKQNYPAFFQRYPMEPHQTALGVLFKQHFDHAKANLRELFVLPGDGRFQIMATKAFSWESVKSAMPNTAQFLLGLVAEYGEGSVHGEDERQAILGNKLPDGSKLTRALLKWFRKDAIPKWLLDESVDLCLELPRLPLTGRRDITLILQNFYSELSKIKQEVFSLYFSVNPYDIVNASNTNGHFSSCNALGGMHQTAPFSALASTSIAQLRLENSKGEMVGRCWVAFGDDFKSVIVQPQYGFLKEEYLQAGLSWITKRLDAKFGAAPWKKLASPYLPLETADLDPGSSGNFYVDRTSILLHRGDTTSIPAIVVGDNYCVICGGICAELYHHDCMNALLKRCDYCGNYMQNFSEEIYCDLCKESIKPCINCGKMCIAENGYCSRCAYVNTFCFCCGAGLQVPRGSRGELLEIFHICGRCKQLQKKPQTSRTLLNIQRGIQNKFNYIEEFLIELNRGSTEFKQKTAYAIAA